MYANLIDRTTPASFESAQIVSDIVHKWMENSGEYF